MKHSSWFTLSLFVFALLLVPIDGYCEVVGTLRTIKSTLVGTIMPLVATLGLIVSAFSFFMGNANARVHLTLAIFGAVIGFGAESIVGFIQSMVR